MNSTTGPVNPPMNYSIIVTDFICGNFRQKAQTPWALLKKF